MKVYLSVDMEGIAGVSHPGPDRPGTAGYPAAVDLMVGEANAAIEGALAGGADDILVNDSHGGMYNLRPADLHPAARVLQGQKAWSMVAGRRPRTPASTSRSSSAITPGPATRAGRSPTPTPARRSRPGSTAGRRASTGSTRSSSARGGSRSGWWPATTRWPRRSPTGCRGPSGSWSRTAAGGNAAASLHPTVARDRIRRGRGTGGRARGGRRPRLARVDPPVVIEVDYSRGVEADHAAIVPGAERVGDRGVRFAVGRSGHRLSRLPAGIRLAVDRRRGEPPWIHARACTDA